MKDPGKPKLHHPEKRRDIPEAPNDPIDTKVMGGMDLKHTQQGHEKHPMPSSYKASMPKMKP